MKIGSHVSNTLPLMLEASAKQTIQNGANAMMVYLGAPQNTFRQDVSKMHIKEMQEVLKENNISLTDVVVHAPYIVNLAQSDDEKFKYAVDFLTKEVKLVEAVGAKYMVLHPGAHVGMGYDYGIERIIEGLNQIIDATPNTSVVITLETMAGKGTECGCTFEQIKQMIDGVKDKTRIGVCLDTCHISDAGYDIVNHYEDVITEFDKTIGLSYLKVIHLNDSKNPISSHKDRHENIGFGQIGFDTLMKFVNDCRFQDIPILLETPYVPDPTDKMKTYEPYKYEIAMIKSGIFDSNIKELIINNN